MDSCTRVGGEGGCRCSINGDRGRPLGALLCLMHNVHPQTGVDASVGRILKIADLVLKDAHSDQETFTVHFRYDLRGEGINQDLLLGVENDDLIPPVGLYLLYVATASAKHLTDRLLGNT